MKICIYTSTITTGCTIDYQCYATEAPGFNLLSIVKETDDDGNVYFTITYEKINDLEITKVASENTSTKLSGAEFTLYKYIGTGTSEDTLIDTNSINTSIWEKVGNITTGSDGKISFDALSAGYEYRLIETKAPTGRLKSSGQWRIQYIYEEAKLTDEGVYNVNNTYMKITGIENPQAIQLSEDSSGTTTLLIPNTKNFDLPVSGDIGITGIYLTGIAILLGALAIITISRRRQILGVRVQGQKKRTAKAKKPSNVRNVNKTQICDIHQSNVEEMLQRCRDLRDKQNDLFGKYKN